MATIDQWDVNGGLPSLRSRMDSPEADPRTTAAMRMVKTILRCDGVNLESKSIEFVEAYYAGGVKSGRLKADDVDPNDHAHRSAVGGNSAVRDPSETPDVSSMDLRGVKAIALSIGSYDFHLRQEIADVVLARLRELGADQLADLCEQLWDGDALMAQSDDDAERAGDAHTDAVDDGYDRELLKQRSIDMSREQLATKPPIRAKKQKGRIK